MDRLQIENNSKEITRKYFNMLSEMLLSEVAQPIDTHHSASNFYYLRIAEISSRWISEEKPIWEIMTKLYISLYSAYIPVSVAFINNGVSTSVFIGCSNQNIDAIDIVLKGSFPQLKYNRNQTGHTKIYKFEDIISEPNYGGYLKGNPTGSENFTTPFQIDSVIKGMAGKPWSLVFFADPVKKNETVIRQQYWLAEASKCSELSDIAFNESDNNTETITYKRNYYHSEQYSDKVKAFIDKTKDSLSMGEWCVTANFFSSTKTNAKMLGGLLVAAFYGEDSEPESVHAIYNSFSPFNILVNGIEHLHTEYSEVPHPKYASFLSSKELAIFSSLPTIDTSGFSITDYVSFDVNRSEDGDMIIGNILESNGITNNAYMLDSNELNRHALVIGLTGSGKTNTIKNLLCGLTKDSSRPFLVIEPAKKEYWELYKCGYDDLQIYSVGSNENNSHTICLNPFERSIYTAPDGTEKSVSIQTHIDFVYAAFKASFIMYTPMPYVLERAIYSIYEDCGWDIHNNINKYGKDIYPTIEDLYYKIPIVVTEMGYDQRMRNDLIGSLQARINSMRIGSKGDTLNVEHSFPMHKILSENVVVELEDIGDDDVKAFIISLILVNLLEYRRQQEDCQLKLRHLILIEEAHRLLKNIQSGTGENADPRGAAVEFFCNLLAELRSKGQGFIVADQIPSKLAPDLIKNTNLKIVHRTVAEEERILIGGAMHMTDKQIDSLSILKQGVAAVYSEGDNHPKLVKPLFAGRYICEDRKEYSRETVLLETSKNCINASGKEEYTSLTDTPKAVCKHCKVSCDKHYNDILKRLDDENEWFYFAESQNPDRIGTCVPDNLYSAIFDYLKQHMIRPESICRSDINCAFACMLESWHWNSNNKHRVIRVFTKKQ